MSENMISKVKKLLLFKMIITKVQKREDSKEKYLRYGNNYILQIIEKMKIVDPNSKIEF